VLIVLLPSSSACSVYGAVGGYAAPCTRRRKVVVQCMGTTLPCKSHPAPTQCWCPACFRWSDDVASPSSTVVGDDMVPTSLNEGRGKMVAPALVVVFHVVDGCDHGGTSRRRAGSQMWKCAKCGQAEAAEACHFWNGCEMGFPVACAGSWSC